MLLRIQDQNNRLDIKYKYNMHTRRSQEGRRLLRRARRVSRICRYSWARISRKSSFTMRRILRSTPTSTTSSSISSCIRYLKNRAARRSQRGIRKSISNSLRQGRGKPMFRQGQVVPKNSHSKWWSLKIRSQIVRT